MTSIQGPPHSPELEASVIGTLLQHPSKVGEVVTYGLLGQHFYLSTFRTLYSEIVDAYYKDGAQDALTIGEMCSRHLSAAWRIKEAEAVARVQQLASGRQAKDALAHAKLVKRSSDYRALLDVASSIQRQVAEAETSPDEIAGIASQEATQIATASLLTNEIVPFDDLGRRFIRHQKMLMRAREEGIELGAYFGLSFIDSFTRGLMPTELFILAGEPGAGKSAVAWKAVEQFAERQMKKPVERRIGSLVLSLEMGEEPSSVRVAQHVAEVDGGKLREGRTSPEDLQLITSEWAKRKDIPLYFNFTSTLRASQMRALIVETIRKYKVGLVVIDHMRYFDMDGRFNSRLEEEEEKARFLKEDIAKSLNLAVIVLAHTTKSLSDDGRPRLRDLRGSYMVAAHADFVGFVYRPYNYARQDDIDSGDVQRTDAEMIYEKNRHGLDGTAKFYFDPTKMKVA